MDNKPTKQKADAVFPGEPALLTAAKPFGNIKSILPSIFASFPSPQQNIF